MSRWRGAGRCAVLSGRGNGARYAFRSHAWRGAGCSSASLDLPPTLTTVGLLYTSIGYVILPALFLGRLRDALRASENRTFLQAWTLRKLFPKA